MELEQLLTLIDSMSNSSLSSLEYENEGVKISLKKETRENQVIIPKEDKTICLGTETDRNDVEEKGYIIKSPLVGTFYEAPSEDAEPFVQVGDRVEKVQALAIVEAMKLMNEIESECAGEVREIYVKNGEMVEYGQPLFRVV